MATNGRTLAGCRRPAYGVWGGAAGRREGKGINVIALNKCRWGSGLFFIKKTTASSTGSSIIVLAKCCETGRGVPIRNRSPSSLWQAGWRREAPALVWSCRQSSMLHPAPPPARARVVEHRQYTHNIHIASQHEQIFCFC